MRHLPARPSRFTLTADHLKLMRRFCIGWQTDEFGAPEVDPKRPYGNSSVEYDIAEILGWTLVPSEDDPDDLVLSEEQDRQAVEIHEQMGTALQIVLVSGSFEPGQYAKRDTYDDLSWEKV